MMQKLTLCHKFVSTFLLNKMPGTNAEAHKELFDHCEMYIRLIYNDQWCSVVYRVLD